MKKIISLLLVVLMLGQLAGVATAVSEPVNVALNAAAFAYGAADGNTAALAVDGDNATTWTSLNTTALCDYLILDLGTAYTVDSIFVTMPDGVAQNFTVYGANDAKQTDKTALTATISGLSADTKSDLGAILSASAFRYIIFEQAASETSFGFTEIEVNTLDDAAASHEFSGTAVLVSSGVTCVAAGSPGSIGSAAAKSAAANFVDADPTTRHYDVWPDVFFIFDLGEAKTLTHLAYQFVGATGTEKLCGQNFKLIGTNSSNYKNVSVSGQDAPYDVLAEMAGAPTYNATNDTGLLIFEVAEAYKNNAYRYIGILKANEGGEGGSNERVGASTLQAYIKGTPKMPRAEVATGKSAFAYSSAPGTGPALALDGDPETVWKSNLATEDVRDSFVIDLGASKPVEEIKVQLADSESSAEYTVYGSNDTARSRTKLCDATSGNAESLTTIFTDDTDPASFRYLVFEKAPSASKMGFAEIEVYARAAKGGNISVSQVSRPGQTVYASADGGAAAIDGDPETGFMHDVRENLPTNNYVLVDLGRELPISHVAYQGIMGSNGPGVVTNRNEFVIGFKVVGTNDPTADPSTFTVLNSGMAKDEAPFEAYTLTGTSYSGAAGDQYDTGLRIFPNNKSAESFRYVGILKNENSIPSQQKLAVFSLQVYSKVNDVIASLPMGVDREYNSDKGLVEADKVGYTADVLNGSNAGKVTGLFVQRDANGSAVQTAKAGGAISMAGAYDMLALSADVTEGTKEKTTWEMALLEGRTITRNISDLKNATIGATVKDLGTSTATITGSGMDVRVSGKVSAGVVGVVVLNKNDSAGNYAASLADFDADDIYAFALQQAPDGATGAWDFDIHIELPEDATKGYYPVGLISDNGALTGVSGEHRMFDTAQIKTDFAAATGENLMGTVFATQENKDFFSDIYTELAKLDPAAVSKSFDIAKSGVVNDNFKDTQDTWGENINDVSDALKATLIVEATLAKQPVETLVNSYGSAMPKIFNNSDYKKNAKDFDEIMPVVITADVDTAEELVTAYNRAIALSLIAGGDKEDKVNALTNYGDALGITKTLAETDLTALDIVAKISGDMSTVKGSYATNFALAVEQAIEEIKEAGGGAEDLGSDGSDDSSPSVSFPRNPIGGGSVTLPSTPVITQPAEKPAQTSSFADVSNHDWAIPSIEILAKRGILAGDGTGNFNPDGLLTREQAVKLLILTLDLPVNAADNVYKKNNGYEDCDYSAWYYPYVTFAKNKKLVEGQARNLFGIGQEVTRQDLAVMIYRALKSNNLLADKQDSFTDDASISDYAKEAVNALGGMGLITGFPDGSFGPQEKTTRAQASVIFERFLSIVEAAAAEEVDAQ